MLHFQPGDDIDTVLHHLASVGGPYLCSEEFAPNGGNGVKPYPVSIAPPAAIEAHLAKYQRGENVSFAADNGAGCMST